jgi:heme/copper-type cytochrome/quinol oxidase subunit 2
MSKPQHPTTRRGFLTAMGFGGVALYGAWAAYGAAPLPFAHALGTEQGHDAEPAVAAEGHGGHGATGGMTPEEFLRRHEEFIARFGRDDGSVDLTVPAGHGHGAPASSEHAAHGSAPGHGTEEPADVYLHAFRFGFAPDEIRLAAGKSYRLRMMTSDITHGASLQLGRGSRIIRLRPNLVSELTIAFNRGGPVLVYCTVFCGAAHDAMKARLLVA